MSDSKSTEQPYFIRVNCIAFKDFKVVGAKSEQEAIQLARRSFSCDSLESEFGEILNEEDANAPEVIEV